MSTYKARLRALNRIVWIALFFALSVTFAWLEWRSEGRSTMGWFLATGLWSAACGIGFSGGEWWIRRSGVKNRRPE